MVERIRALLESRQLTPTQFADLIGVARPIVSHILSGRNKPSLEVVQRILAAMPDLAMPWLLNGSGPMLAVAGSLAGSPLPISVTLAPSDPASEATPERADTLQPAESQQDSQVKREASVPKASAGVPVGRHSTKAVEQVARMNNPSAQQPPATLKRFDTKPAAVQKSGESDQMQSRGPAGPGLEPALALSSPIVTPTTSKLFNVTEAETGPPVANASETADSGNPTANTAPTNAVAQAMLAGADKPIRRIVIFYRDGSFADYQPE